MPNDEQKTQTQNQNENRAKRPKGLNSVFWAGFAVLLAAFLIGLYFSGRLGFLGIGNQENAQNNSNKNGSADDGKVFAFNLAKPVFAEYSLSGTDFAPALKTQKPELAELENLADFEKAGAFSAAEKAMLGAQGFFLRKNNFITDQTSGVDDFADTYANFSGSKNIHYRSADNALFISSDLALHLYHILVDRSFQKIEEEKFQPALRSMTEALFKDALANYNAAENEALKASYGRLAAYYLVPLVVLDAADANNNELSPSDFETYAKFLEAQEQAIKDAGESDLAFALPSPEYKGMALADAIYAPAKAELLLISAARGMADSPLFTPYRPYLINDYSQFKPRAHYTKNDILKSYFIAMMWYGRMGFSLDSPDLTRDAIIITGQINNLQIDGQGIAETYAVLSAAIEFFVGKVDDLTPYEYTDLLKKQYGDSLTGAELLDEEKLDNFIASAIRDLPKPKIVSEAVELFDDGGERDELLKQLMQFRFLGQRFTPDAYVLNQLTQGVGAPDPETGQNLPSMTTALMPMHALSPENALVKNYIQQWVSANAPDSDRIIEKKLKQMSAEFAEFSEDAWTENIYWSWLNTYRSLLAGYGQGYPYFMAGEAWQKKNLGTVLGSYAELKHDTLLYAKQSYAELGGGGDEPAEIPPVPKGYVEADPVFWARISALARQTADGLADRELMPDYFGERYAQFIEISEFFQKLAKQELLDETISDDDFEKLRLSGYVFQNLAAALPGEELADKDRRAGIIADIHTDAVLGKILYQATGKPHIIYAAVKDDNGTRLTRGLVYNHYEFTGPLSERYSDEDWQAQVYEDNGGLPEQDAWTQELMPAQ